MRILRIGDSNTWGFDPNTGLRHKNRWTRQLMALRPQDEIIEEGMNGRTFAFDDPFTPGRNGLRALDMLLMSHEPADFAHASPVDNVHMDETNHGRLAQAIHQTIEERKKGEGQ